MKKTKIIIPAMGMLLLGTAASVTGTVAWFSANTKVNVTGMNVTTRVNNSMLIAGTTTSATDALNENDFKTNFVADISALLEPVSTIDGENFFYAQNNNVKGDGSVLSNAYIVYDRSGNAGKNAFDANYGFQSDDNDEDCVGYVDYAFQLKATNTSTSASAYLNITTLELSYGNSQSPTEHAYRVGIFVEDIGAALADTTGDVGDLKSILKPSAGAYFTTGKAVKTVSTLDDVSELGSAANIGSVAAGQTHYFKVVVRLWLEGEDTSCNNATFAALTDKWALDLSIDLQAATGGVTALATSVTSPKINLSADSASATTVVVDGVTYYQLTTNTSYYSSTSLLTSASRIFTITNGHPVEVTHKCTLPA